MLDGVVDWGPEGNEPGRLTEAALRAARRVLELCAPLAE